GGIRPLPDMTGARAPSVRPSASSFRFPPFRPPAGADAGGVAERLKAHAWKACIRETVSRVRIPLPPPIYPRRNFSGAHEPREKCQELRASGPKAPDFVDPPEGGFRLSRAGFLQT